MHSLTRGIVRGQERSEAVTTTATEDLPMNHRGGKRRAQGTHLQNLSVRRENVKIEDDPSVCKEYMRMNMKAPDTTASTTAARMKHESVSIGCAPLFLGDEINYWSVLHNVVDSDKFSLLGMDGIGEQCLLSLLLMSARRGWIWYLWQCKTNGNKAPNSEVIT